MMGLGYPQQEPREHSLANIYDGTSVATTQAESNWPDQGEDSMIGVFPPIRTCQNAKNLEALHQFRGSFALPQVTGLFKIGDTKLKTDLELRGSAYPKVANTRLRSEPERFQKRRPRG